MFRNRDGYAREPNRGVAPLVGTPRGHRNAFCSSRLPRFRSRQVIGVAEISWRRERDSNPRYGFPYSGFQDRPFQPLTHPSAYYYQRFNMQLPKISVPLVSDSVK